MQTFQVCDIPDKGSFADGEHAALAFDVLKRTANHSVPDRIDLSASPHLKPYAIACLCALGELGARRSNKVELILPQDSEAANHLVRLGLHKVFKCNTSPTVQIKETNLPAEIVQWPPGNASIRIMQMLAPQADLSPGVFPSMAASLDEMIGNALTHAKSPVDCVVVGQSFPATKKVEVAILDLGMTIRGHLSKNPKHAPNAATDRAAIELATQDGVTGTPDGQMNCRGFANSGAGLAELRSFCESGRGELTILSGDCWVTYSANPMTYGTLRGSRFMGCLVNVRYFI